MSSASSAPAAGSRPSDPSPRVARPHRAHHRADHVEHVRGRTDHLVARSAVANPRQEHHCPPDRGRDQLCVPLALAAHAGLNFASKITQPPMSAPTSASPRPGWYAWARSRPGPRGAPSSPDDRPARRLDPHASRDRRRPGDGSEGGGTNRDGPCRRGQRPRQGAVRSRHRGDRPAMAERSRETLRPVQEARGTPRQIAAHTRLGRRCPREEGSAGGRSVPTASRRERRNRGTSRLLTAADPRAGASAGAAGSRVRRRRAPSGCLVGGKGVPVVEAPEVDGPGDPVGESDARRPALAGLVAVSALEARRSWHTGHPISLGVHRALAAVVIHRPRGGSRAAGEGGRRAGLCQLSTGGHGVIPPVQAGFRLPCLTWRSRRTREVRS